MPANRVAALVAVLTQIGVLIAAVAGAFPGKYGDALAASAALITKAVVIVKFLDGSQKSEALAKSAIGNTATFIGGVPLTTTLSTTIAGTKSEFADEEPGDPDGLPHLPTQVAPPADGNDQVHA